MHWDRRASIVAAGYRNYWIAAYHIVPEAPQSVSAVDEKEVWVAGTVDSAVAEPQPADEQNYAGDALLNRKLFSDHFLDNQFAMTRSS